MKGRGRTGVTRRGAALSALGFALAQGCATATSLDNGEAFRAQKKFAPSRDGLRMAYYEVGAGSPIVFLHGNPTSSYLWRHVIPHIARHGRCVAPDLIGMGDSDRLAESGPGRYTFAEHGRHLEALLDTIGLREDVVLVIHDWGGPLGFDWAMRHRERVTAIALMETFVVSQNDGNTPAQTLQFFTGYRSGEAERDVLENNSFVENVMLRQFPDMPAEVQAEYRRPFLQPGESRRPTLEWPRQVPINGEPADVHAATLECLAFMAQTPLPKLFIRAEPGALISMGREQVCRAWPSVTERVVSGRHFLPEESPHQIGGHIAEWIAGLR